MDIYPLTSQQITQALQAALEPQGYVQAMWQAGAASFDRIDLWSDIDLMVVVNDENVEDAFQQIEEALGALSPIELNWRLPQPTWHGHDQAFYRLKEASPYLLIDIAVMKMSSPEKFLQPELHGQAQVFFDKAQVVQWTEFDWEAHRRTLQARLETLKVTFDLFQITTLKELHRSCPIDALAYYQAFTLRPLVEVLRMRHDPARYNFGSRYLYYDLPSEDVDRLEKLFFVRSPGELLLHHTEAGSWFKEAVEELEAYWVQQQGGENRD
jgi:hypothetical protein